MWSARENPPLRTAQLRVRTGRGKLRIRASRSLRIMISSDGAALNALLMSICMPRQSERRNQDWNQNGDARSWQGNSYTSNLRRLAFSFRSERRKRAEYQIRCPQFFSARSNETRALLLFRRGESRLFWIRHRDNQTSSDLAASGF